MKLQEHYHRTVSLLLIRMTLEQCVNSQIIIPLEALSTAKVYTKSTQRYPKKQIGKQFLDQRYIYIL